MNSGRASVLILGAGINGCALARELALNGLSVIVLDRADIASGTTAYSSRLVHGGLRYLEYGELELVRESLGERTRLLRLAPQFVKPLELFIPVRARFAGLWPATRRILGWDPTTAAGGDRGLWLMRVGLWLYDTYARDPTLPRHRVLPLAAGPPVDAKRFHWQAAYFDAQVPYPERLTVALLADARLAAEARGQTLRVLTYHQAHLEGTQVEVRHAETGELAGEPFTPLAIINATGAWVDLTLAQLSLASPRLMGGTKGSHLLLARPDLAAALAGRGIYTLAADDRPIFILPLGNLTLVGTTDEPYSGDPADVTASPADQRYLLQAVREVFPQFQLDSSDVAWSYSGIRPLPHTDSVDPGAVTRRHFIKRHADAPLPIFSIIGGKLTTARSLAEEATEQILAAVDLPVVQNSRDRAVPGGENYPATADALTDMQQALAQEFQLPISAVQTAWQLLGTRSREVLTQDDRADGRSLLTDSDLPLAVVRWAIRQEWADRLDDLVERRLMLLYKDRLTRGCLQHLAEILVAEGRLPAGEVDFAVRGTIERLHRHFGHRID